MQLGGLHPIFVHFPIVLFSLGLFCDLLNGIGKKVALPVAHWLFISAAITCIPTFISGWQAEEALSPGNVYIEQHHMMAFITTAVGMAYALFRFLCIQKQWELPPLVYVSCSVLTALLVGITANYGSLVAWGTSVFTF